MSSIKFPVNIFERVQAARKSTEPVHSRLLAEWLRVSLRQERSLFESFWNISVQKDPDWAVPDNATVVEEDVIDQMRVDITIRDIEKKKCLGVEIKTREASTDHGQLQRYQTALEGNYPGFEVRMAYLTPLTRKTSPDLADSLPSVKEFEAFSQDHPEAVHISWLDVVDLRWAFGGELWDQHSEYVREVISRPPSGRIRQLEEFLGAEAVEDFWRAVISAGAADDDGTIELSEILDPAKLVDAFKILADSDLVRKDRHRGDAFSDELKTKFIESEHGEVHRALFQLASDYSWAWIEGKNDYGLRVDYSAPQRNGVSICTSRGPDRLSVGRLR